MLFGATQAPAKTTEKNIVKLLRKKSQKLRKVLQALSATGQAVTAQSHITVLTGGRSIHRNKQRTSTLEGAGGARATVFLKRTT